MCFNVFNWCYTSVVIIIWKGRFPDFVNGTRVNTIWTENTICKRELFNTRICSNRSNYVNCVLYVRKLIWNVVFSLCYMRTFKQSSFTKVSFKMKSLSFIQEQPFCRIIQRVWLLQRKINLLLLCSLNQTQYLNYSIFKLSTSVFVVDINCMFVCLLHLKKKKTCLRSLESALHGMKFLSLRKQG